MAKDIVENLEAAAAEIKRLRALCQSMIDVGIPPTPGPDTVVVHKATLEAVMAVVKAAEGVTFFAYPAHGTGFVTGAGGTVGELLHALGDYHKVCGPAKPPSNPFGWTAEQEAWQRTSPCGNDCAARDECVRQMRCVKGRT